MAVVQTFFNENITVNEAIEELIPDTLLRPLPVTLLRPLQDTLLRPLPDTLLRVVFMKGCKGSLIRISHPILTKKLNHLNRTLQV